MALRKSGITHDLQATQVELHSLHQENQILQFENDLARRTLWLSHGHPSKALCADDGEMYCAMCAPFSDWKRMPLTDILTNLNKQKEDVLRFQYEAELVAEGLKPLPPIALQAFKPKKLLTNS